MNIYAYQRPLGPIADDEALRQQCIAVYDVKTHQQVVRFCHAYGHRLHKLIGYDFPYSSDIADAYDGMVWNSGLLARQTIMQHVTRAFRLAARRALQPTE